MGKPFDEKLKNGKDSRGCRVRHLGKLHCDAKGAFDRFDIVGVGKAWSHKMNYTRHAMSVESYFWMDAADKLNRTGGCAEPDEIIQAKVLRKRMHEYKPRVIK